MHVSLNLSETIAPARHAGAQHFVMACPSIVDGLIRSSRNRSRERTGKRNTHPRLLLVLLAGLRALQIPNMIVGHKAPTMQHSCGSTGAAYILPLQESPRQPRKCFTRAHVRGRSVLRGMLNTLASPRGSMQYACVNGLLLQRSAVCNGELIMSASLAFVRAGSSCLCCSGY